MVWLFVLENKIIAIQAQICYNMGDDWRVAEVKDRR